MTFDEGLPVTAPDGQVDLIALDTALERLAALDADQARIVELRYFGGLSVEEAAEVLASHPSRSSDTGRRRRPGSITRLNRMVMKANGQDDEV